MTRKLVTIRPVKDIVPIPGADRIVLAIIDGWQVVVKKDTHTVGELVLFYEIDSFLPAEDPRYAFLDAEEASGKGFIQWGDKRGARLKSVKMRKQLSQGLVLPLADFPEVLNLLADTPEADKIGLDVTELLKVEKWEKIEKSNSGSNVPGANRERAFPYFIRKTDQERIQNYGGLVQRAVDAGEVFEITVKKDGSSLTVFRVDPDSPYYKDACRMVAKKASFLQRLKRLLLSLFEAKQPVFGICSRNMLLTLEGESNFHKAVDKYSLLYALDNMGGSYALQGELVAPNIQDNYEKVDDVEFHLFDIFDIDKQEYVLPEERQDEALFCAIPHTTILERGTTLTKALGLAEGDDVVKAALAYAEGPGDNPGVMREGVVMKSLTRDFSFKAVSNSYLLKTGK